MKAARIHRFGPPDVIVIDDLPRPVPGPGQVLLRVASAGVGPWDALIREQKSVINSPLPLTLGSDLSGVVEALGAGVTASSQDTPYLQSLGATTVIDYKSNRFEDIVPMVDIVLDTIGGETRSRSLGIIKPSGILVSIVSEPLPRTDELSDIRAVFFLVEVMTKRLDQITRLFDQGKLVARVGTVLPLPQARTAHQMLAGAPHKPGKIVLSIADFA